VEKLAEDVDARAVLAGTYGVGATSVVVNIRMIDFMTGDIISVAMTELARTKAIDSLLLNPEKRVQETIPTAYDNQGF
jgi:TolB-like protein